MTSRRDPTSYHNMQTEGMRAMILAAGLGTRLKPWTNSHPKALAMVNAKSLLQRNIEYLQQFNIHEVIVNVHHFADQIIQAIETNNGWGSNIIFSNESDEVLETGGGLKKASWWLNQAGNDFLVMNVDILTDLNIHDMLRSHRTYKSLATLAVSTRETSRYFLFDDNNTLCGWKNEKTGETRIARDEAVSKQAAFSGLQLLNASIFEHIRQEGKFSIVDAYLDLAKTHAIRAYDHTGSLFIDVGKPESLERAAQFFHS